MRLSIYVSDDLGNKIIKDAQTKKRKVSQLITEMIQDYYNDYNDHTKDQGETYEETTATTLELKAKLEAKEQELKTTSNELGVLKDKLEETEKELGSTSTKLEVLTVELESRERELVTLKGEHQKLWDVHALFLNRTLPVASEVSEYETVVDTPTPTPTPTNQEKLGFWSRIWQRGKRK